jgi:hypothetical protein
MSKDFKDVMTAILAMFAIASLTLLLFPTWKYLGLDANGQNVFKVIMIFIAIGSVAGIVVNIAKKRA